MPVGRILEVDTEGRTARVLLRGRSDDSVIEGAILTESSEFIRSLPRAGKLVRIVNDGSEWLVTNYIREWSTENAEQNELDRITPGDSIMGENGAKIGYYNGGLVVLMANEVTGVMASDSKSTLNLLGHNIYEDNSVYHRSVKTQEGSAVLSSKAYGQAGLVSLEETSDLRTGSISIQAEGITEIDVDVNKSLANLSALSVNIELSTIAGIVSFKVEANGNITMTTPAKIKLQGLAIGLNSDCINPLDGVVTAATICPFTRLPHADASKCVFAAKAAL
jgi:hypothetical protein